VPAVISLAFWGGVWGIIMIPALARITNDAMYYLAAIVFGAVLPTLVAGLVVAPLKHQPVPHSVSMLMLGLIVNGGNWYFSYRNSGATWELHHIEMMLRLNAGDYIQWAMNKAPGPDSSTTGGAYQANHNTCTIWLVG